MIDDVQSGGNERTVHRQQTQTWLQVNLPLRWGDARIDFTEPGCAAERHHECKQRATGGIGVNRDLTPHRYPHRICAAAAVVEDVAAHAAPVATALH